MEPIETVAISLEIVGLNSEAKLKVFAVPTSTPPDCIPIADDDVTPSNSDPSP